MMQLEAIVNRALHIDFLISDLAECAHDDDIRAADIAVFSIHEFMRDSAVRWCYSSVATVLEKIEDILTESESMVFIQLIAENFPIRLQKIYDMFRIHDSKDLKIALMQNIVAHQAVAHDSTDATSSRSIALAKLLIKKGEGEPLVLLLGELLKFNPTVIAEMIVSSLRLKCVETEPLVHAWIKSNQDQVVPLLVNANEASPLSYRELVDMIAAGCSISFSQFPESQAKGLDLIYHRHALGEEVLITDSPLSTPNPHSLGALASYCMVHNLRMGELMSMASNRDMTDAWKPMLDAVINSVELEYVHEDAGLRQRMGVFLDKFLSHHPERIAQQAVSRYPREWLMNSSIYRTAALETDLGL